MVRTGTIILLAIVSFLVACSGREDVCIVNAEFSNLKGGELYLYALDGSRNQMDTVTVRDGKFTYEANRTEPGFVILLFPNMSEQVIFLVPGKTVEVKADATHLKNMTIKGGEDNKLMSAFRDGISDLKSEKEIRQRAKEYITANPQSLVSMYLLEKYFIQSDYDNIQEMEKMLGQMRKAQPHNGRLVSLSGEVARCKLSMVGAKAPDFAVAVGRGDTARLADYRDRMLVIDFWSSWAVESRDERAKLRTAMEDPEWKGKVDVLSVSLDEVKYAVFNARFDSVPGRSSCDFKGYGSSVCSAYGVRVLPLFVLIDSKGVIRARSGSMQQIEREVDKLIEKDSQKDKN